MPLFRNKETFKCPNCEQTLHLDLDKLVPGRKIKCSNCNSDVTYTEDDIKKILSKLGRNFSKIFKKFK